MQNAEYSAVVPLICILLSSYTTGRPMSLISGHSLSRYVVQFMHFIGTVKPIVAYSHMENRRLVEQTWNGREHSVYFVN
jgi:hypothetical protein